jgi:hypothetical protein
MHWINIHTETLRGEEFVGAEPLERATWLSLLGWCCAQENSGRITGGANWTSRKWQQICGVTLEEVQTESQLYEVDGDDLIVHFYPLEHQEKAAASRVNGKKGGRPKKIKQAETLTQQGNKPIGSILVNLDDNLDLTQSEPSHNPNSKSNFKETVTLTKKEDKTETQKRVGALVKRRESTKWSDKEKAALRKLNPSEEDIAFLESQNYADHTYRRKDLMTLLNHWNGELDRMNSKQQHSTPQHQVTEFIGNE